MKRLSNFLTSAFGATIILGTVHASGVGWTSDFEAAKKNAAAEGMSLLMNFTGSDWCGWCIKLKKEVFSQDEFKEGAKGKFVLVELDFPQDESKLTAEMIAQNGALNEKYLIQGFPTIILSGEEGKPFAQTGYQPGGPAAYLAHLDELLMVRSKRDAAFATADQAEGIGKAKALAVGLKALQLDGGLIAAFYGDKLDSLRAADPTDDTGYIRSVEEPLRFGKFELDLNAFAAKGDAQGALTLIDETLKSGEFQGQLQLQAMIFKANVLMQIGRSGEAIETLEKAKALATDELTSSTIEDIKVRFAKMAAKNNDTLR